MTEETISCPMGRHSIGTPTPPVPPRPQGREISKIGAREAFTQRQAAAIAEEAIQCGHTDL
jgi:hypothetical protein